MPRENRKRGKKHKKNLVEEYKPCPPRAEIAQQPSWIISSSEAVDAEAPFGELESDVKAYFRTVDLQIRSWQGDQGETSEEDDFQLNEKKRIFFMAALDEMRGKERQLATDPECSVILERLLYSMDDFVLRVFVDSLAGSYGALIRHRFASHVCQTIFFVAKETVTRESKGIIPNLSASPEQGELRTLIQLILDICEEVLQDISSLLTHPFASHVIRSLLVLLSPNLNASDEAQGTVRSKKSASWKARQGQMKSVFDDGKKGKERESSLKDSLPEFALMSRRIIETVNNLLDDNEVRGMAADKVACPTLQMLLKVEARQDIANRSGSLMDRVTVGAVTGCLNDASDDISESDYLGTLVRDPNASHLLEIVVTHSPPNVFDVIWKLYFEGKLARLAVHPVANFVVSKALERVSERQLLRTLKELNEVWEKFIQTSRTGVMRAFIDRVSALNISGLKKIPEIVLSAFCFQKHNVDNKLLVHCILTLQSLSECQKTVEGLSADEPQSHAGKTRSKKSKGTNPLEPKLQGSLLLQSLLKLPAPLNQFLVESILDLSVDQRIQIAQHACGSRVFDVFLESATVPADKKRQLVMDFVGHYHHLVDDKVGSRVVDRCWEFSDTYLREKIARSLISKEQELASSFYGKFFAKNLNLYLLQRRPEEWRNLQSERRRKDTTQLNDAKPEGEMVSQKRKRKSRPQDDIDALFDERLGRKTKRLALAVATPPTVVAIEKQTGNKDKVLEQVLGAIRSAPKGNSLSGRKKSKRSHD